jgi:hypothetical protein
VDVHCRAVTCYIECLTRRRSRAVRTAAGMMEGALINPVQCPPAINTSSELCTSEATEPLLLVVVLDLVFSREPSERYFSVS